MSWDIGYSIPAGNKATVSCRGTGDDNHLHFLPGSLVVTKFDGNCYMQET